MSTESREQGCWFCDGAFFITNSWNIHSSERRAQVDAIKSGACLPIRFPRRCRTRSVFTCQYRAAHRDKAIGGIGGASQTIEPQGYILHAHTRVSIREIRLWLAWTIRDRPGFPGKVGLLIATCHHETEPRAKQLSCPLLVNFLCQNGESSGLPRREQTNRGLGS